MAAESSKGDEKNTANIPKAVFVEDIDAFMKQPENANLEPVARQIEEQYQKYKFMESNFVKKKDRLKIQSSHITPTLDIVRHMQTKKDSTEPTQTHFLLSDQVYVKAKIPPTDKVALWLGANVMLEYKLDDAEQLLSKNFEAANKEITKVEDNLAFLRDQITTIEVNKARLHNWAVKTRQAAQKQAS